MINPDKNVNKWMKQWVIPSSHCQDKGKGSTNHEELEGSIHSGARIQNMDSIRGKKWCFQRFSGILTINWNVQMTGYCEEAGVEFKWVSEYVSWKCVWVGGKWMKEKDECIHWTAIGRWSPEQLFSFRTSPVTMLHQKPQILKETKEIGVHVNTIGKIHFFLPFRLQRWPLGKKPFDFVSHT